jgi:enoyl-CoA hydratase/carnithine racemase
MSDRVAIEIDRGVAEVRLTRADKMNAFDDTMFEAVLAAGSELTRRTDLRCVVLSAEGRAFSAGLDLGMFDHMTGGGAELKDDLLLSERSASGANRAQQVAFAWRELPVPVIAAMHGVAIGAGLQLALGADLRFAAPDTRVSAFEMNWGLIPDMGAFALLRRLVRDDVFRELIYSGRMVAAEEAASLGLVTRICADPRAEALICARAIADRHPAAIRAAKRIINASFDADQETVLRQEAMEQAGLIGTTNHIEAIYAQREKRTPIFED